MWHKVLKVLAGKSQERDHMKDPCADSIKVKQIIKKYCVRVLSGFKWLRQGMGGGLFMNMRMRC
jgi:hypothetical protein